MIRTTAVPRPVRLGAALVGVAGIVTLAGCAGTGSAAEGEAPASQAPASSSSPAATGSAGGSSASTYADGTYTAEGSYRTPESTETVTVTVTLAADVITEVEVTGDPQARQSQEYQGRFIGGVRDVVVGKDIDEISVDRVAGSSLTSGGFNEAIETIKSEAAA